jgi:hypothetical protein
VRCCGIAIGKKPLLFRLIWSLEARANESKVAIINLTFVAWAGMIMAVSSAN